MSASAAVWKRAVRAARDGSPRMLLELLLAPRFTDGPGNPIRGPGGARPFYDLPDDLELRKQIVAVLLFGPWPRDGTIEQLSTHDGWGKGKPTLSELEVSFADLLLQMTPRAERASARDSLTEAYGLKDGTVGKRIGKQRRQRR